MRLWAVIRKSLREQLREQWLVFLVLALGPFFVVLFWLMFGAGTWAGKVVVVNEDRGALADDGLEIRGGLEVQQALRALKTANGSPALVVLQARDDREAEALLVRGEANALFHLPADFSASLAAWRAGRREPRATLVYSGDMASMTYMVTAVQAITSMSSYVGQVSRDPGPVDFVERPLGGSGGRSDLDLALPGLFVFALILLIFPTAMTLARESDSGCLRRLQLTPLTAFDLLGGVAAVQLSIGIVGLLLTFACARLCGFHSQGPLWVAIGVSIVGGFACIGVGLLTAAFSRSVTEAFILGNFPMLVLMFFSGAMIPMPKIVVFQIGGTSVGLWDWLPTTHAVAVLNRVLGVGVGLDQVLYETGMLVLLSIVYFAMGVWAFQRRRMAAA